jgi:hypothetical protein
MSLRCCAHLWDMQDFVYEYGIVRQIWYAQDCSICSSHFVFGMLGTTPLLQLNLFLEACFLDFYEHLLLL